MKVLTPTGKALLLAFFTLVCTSVLTVVYVVTKTPIEESEHLRQEQRLNALIPPSLYNNTLGADQIHWQDNMLGSPEPQTIWRARQDGKPVAAIISAVAPDGYAGPIRLLIAISWEYELIAARVISHKETPGLGDDIEISKSDWIKGFDGIPLDSLNDKQWAVKKDGGVFDQFTGATVTPRAVISAIHSTLMFFKKNREEIFAL